MYNREVKIIFIFESQEDTFKCKSNEKLGEILMAFASKKDLDHNQINFLLDGRRIESSDYNKPISQFVTIINEGNLHILASKNEPSENVELLNLNQDTTAVLWFDTEPIEIKTHMNTKMKDISQSFANKIGKNLNSLIFKYREQQLDNSKSLYQIANQNDKNRRKLDIFVEETFNNLEDTINNANTKNNSFFEQNKKAIIIILILIILIIILVILFFLFIYKKPDEPEITDVISSINFPTDKIKETNKFESTDKIIKSNKIIAIDKIIGTNKILPTEPIMKSNNIIPTAKIIKTNKIIVTDKIIETNKIIPTEPIMTNNIIPTAKIIETEKYRKQEMPQSAF